jgi:hypothetical protein
MAFSIYTLYRQIFKVWRRKRLALFQHYISPRMGDSLLDVGGYPIFWTTHPPMVGHIDTLNLHAASFDPAKFPAHQIRPLEGDGRALQFADGSYDIAFSNSVIEHVGSWEDQKRFAAEICRVGKRVWCQTPALECPIEPHFLAPLVHWMPRRWRPFIVRYLTPRGWAAKGDKAAIQEMVDWTRLVSKREMKELFPDCRIVTEYLVPFVPKSYIAVRV